MAPGVMEYARTKLPPLVFEARRARRTLVGVDVVRCRRRLANAPFPLPILHQMVRPAGVMVGWSPAAAETVCIRWYRQARCSKCPDLWV